MALSYRLGSASSRGLHNLCAAEGLPHHGQHTALGDAEATAALFGVYLRRAQASGARNLAEIGVSPLHLPHPAEHAEAAAVPTKARTSAPIDDVHHTTAPATGNPRLDAYLNTVEYLAADAATTNIESQELRRLADEFDLTPDDIAITRHYQPKNQRDLSRSGAR